MEHRLQDWLQVTSGNFLGDSASDSWIPQYRYCFASALIELR